MTLAPPTCSTPFSSFLVTLSMLLSVLTAPRMAALFRTSVPVLLWVLLNVAPGAAFNQTLVA
jgi:hypothetical protein